MEEAKKVAEKIGNFPLIIRPAFTLGGQGGGIAYNREEFEEIITRGLDLSPVSEVLIEESLLGWKEFEMEVMRDRADNCVVICSIENLDPHGRAHRRLDHRRPDPDPHRPRIPDHARRLVRRASARSAWKPAARTSSSPPIPKPAA
jgi:carbamoylphosphate synthase large subunit